MKNRFNYTWRVIGSGLCFVIFGIGTLVLSLLLFVLAILLPVSAKRKQRMTGFCIQFMSGLFVNLMSSFGLIRVCHQFHSPLPTSGHLIIANHPSLIDALIIAAKTPNLCCLVKAPLFANPFTGYIVRLAGYIPNQSDTLLGDARAALLAGKNLLIFPEGTRNTRDRQLAFKRGAANIALYTPCPITPVLINFNPRTLQKGDPWYKVPERAPDITMAVFAPVAAERQVDKQAPITLQARQLNKMLISYYRNRLSSEQGVDDFSLASAHPETGRFTDGSGV